MDLVKCKGGAQIRLFFQHAHVEGVRIGDLQATLTLAVSFREKYLFHDYTFCRDLPERVSPGVGQSRYVSLF